MTQNAGQPVSTLYMIKSFLVCVPSFKTNEKFNGTLYV